MEGGRGWGGGGGFWRGGGCWVWGNWFEPIILVTPYFNLKLFQLFGVCCLANIYIYISLYIFTSRIVFSVP